jgi:hypothetical protein
MASPPRGHPAEVGGTVLQHPCPHPRHRHTPMFRSVEPAATLPRTTPPPVRGVHSAPPPTRTPAATAASAPARPHTTSGRWAPGTTPKMAGHLDSCRHGNDAGRPCWAPAHPGRTAQRPPASSSALSATPGTATPASGPQHAAPGSPPRPDRPPPAMQPPRRHRRRLAHIALPPFQIDLTSSPPSLAALRSLSRWPLPTCSL